MPATRARSSMDSSEVADEVKVDVESTTEDKIEKPVAEPVVEKEADVSGETGEAITPKPKLEEEKADAETVEVEKSPKEAKIEKLPYYLGPAKMADSCVENSDLNIAKMLMNLPLLLHSALSTVTKINIRSAFPEVLSAMKTYICHHRLYDLKDPRTVYCDKNLSSIFNTKQFTLFELKKMLLRVILKNNAETTRDLLKIFQARVHKRKSEDSDDINKKFRLDSNHISEKTAVCIKEDSFSSNSSSENEFVNSHVTPIEKIYEVEYEVDSTSASDDMTDITDSVSEYDLETLQAAVVTISTITSGEEFWADGSFNEQCESEDEISQNDKWKCFRCGIVSKPPRRWCLKCWGWGNRQGRLVDHSEGRIRPRRKTKRNSITQSYSSVKKNDVEVQPGSSSASEKSDFNHKGNKTKSDAKLCILCCMKPMDATVVHGKIGHQFSCYKCAQRLVTLKMPCSLCRRRIEKVIHMIVFDGFE